MKIEVNENVYCLLNFINDSENEVTWKELVQYAIDYKCYKELYIHQSIIEKILKEHNKSIEEGNWVKPA